MLSAVLDGSMFLAVNSLLLCDRLPYYELLYYLQQLKNEQLQKTQQFQLK